jgi:hemin uptake protein HemP
MLDCDWSSDVCSSDLPPLGKRPRLHSEHLFRGGDEVEIVHGQALYRLRITSLGKLILTK